LPERTIAQLRLRHQTRAKQLPDLEDPDGFAQVAESGRLQRELIQTERKFLHQLLRDGQIPDESRRRIERDLDLEEAAIANREHAATPL
jgi:CPA1 family monovalent cation:H+ antiporter